MPFQSKLVDQTVLVMNPDYGARLQLQKIVMLDVADIIVVNKTDLERAKAALSESDQLLDVVLDEIRTISHLLHPPLLDESGLAYAARWYVDGFASRSGIQSCFDVCC